MSDYKRMLLAVAEKAGQPVHPGLRQVCIVKQMLTEERIVVDALLEQGNPNKHYHAPDMPESCPNCTNMPGFQPNRGPWTMIAACQAQGFTVLFDGEGGVFVGTGEQDYGWWGYGPDNPTALADAMIKATKMLKPDNWEECDAFHGPAVTDMEALMKHCSVECTCAGTRIVIKEAKDGN